MKCILRCMQKLTPAYQPVKIFQNHAMCLSLNHALSLLQLGQRANVAGALQQATKRMPTFADAWINFGVFLQSADEMGLCVPFFTSIML